jgi:hypothetical protein
LGYAADVWLAASALLIGLRERAARIEIDERLNGIAS